MALSNVEVSPASERLIGNASNNESANFYSYFGGLLMSVIVFVFSSSSKAQSPPAIQWQNTISANGMDYLRINLPTADGGYICGGTTDSNIGGDKTENSMGGTDYWVVKLNSSGAIVWQQTIGGSGDDALYNIVPTNDGGYLCAGNSFSGISGDKTDSSRGNADYWIVKLDSLGQLQWQKTIGGNAYDVLYMAKHTLDGGYILGGNSTSDISGDKTEYCRGGFDMWLVKTDSIGNIQWQKTIGGYSSDEMMSIAQTADSGYIFGGYSQSNIGGEKTDNCRGVTDFWIIKTNTTGGIQWQRTLGGTGTDQLWSIDQTDDHGYICAGGSNSDSSGEKLQNSKGYYDYWIVKLDSLGAISWQKTIGGSDWDILQSIEQTNDGGYICGGYSASDITGDKTTACRGVNDYWVLKLTANGNIVWQKTIGGNANDYFSSGHISNDGGYVLGGYSGSGISGDKLESSIGFDFWVVKLGSIYTGLSNISPSTQNELHIYPNPATNNFSIKLDGQLNSNIEFMVQLENSIGQTVYSSNYFPGTLTSTVIPTSSLHGIYFVKLLDRKGKVLACNKVIID
jgi:Secretion system C-terminal sorting domain